MNEQETPLLINVDKEYGKMTTPVARHDPTGESQIRAACPTHGEQLFHYNNSMDAYFCVGYWWGGDFEEGALHCDSVILTADMIGDPDGGPVRHRHTMERVTEAEYQAGESTETGSLARASGRATGSTFDGDVIGVGPEKRHKITKRSEPTPPPGWTG
jgi:hypothetical protein